MNDKDLILHPVKAEEFFEQYWESQPLHVSRKDTGHFAEILSAEGINRYLADNELKYPDIQVVDANRSISAKSYSTNRIIQPDQLLEHHSKGATIILSEVHKKFSAMTEVCWRVNRAFQVVSQANAYLSPPGNQGFHPHYDTHDVFILQVSGRKTFRFYPSEIELPFPDDTFHPDNNSGGDVVEEVELSAGDTLYIPRGIVHDALAHEGEPSLHITLGVFPFIVRDLLQEIVQVAAERDVGYRAFVDLRDKTQKAEDAGLQDLLGGLLSEEIYREALSRLSDSVAVGSITTQNTESVQEITTDAIIQIDESSILSFEAIHDHFKLRVAGQVLRFYEPYSASVESLVAGNALTLGQLPGLTMQQGRALCAQLLAVNAIKIA